MRLITKKIIEENEGSRWKMTYMECSEVLTTRKMVVKENRCYGHGTRLLFHAHGWLTIFNNAVERILIKVEDGC